MFSLLRIIFSIKTQVASLQIYKKIYSWISKWSPWNLNNKTFQVLIKATTTLWAKVQAVHNLVKSLLKTFYWESIIPENFFIRTTLGGCTKNTHGESPRQISPSQTSPGNPPVNSSPHFRNSPDTFLMSVITALNAMIYVLTFLYLLSLKDLFPFLPVN